MVAVSVRMYIVQPKSLQECRIVYQPQLATNNSAISTITESIIFLPDKPTDNSKADEDDDAIVESVQQSSTVVNNIMDAEITSNHLMLEVMNPTTPLNLMTPDSFNSPIRHNSDELTNVQVPTSQPQSTVSSASSSTSSIDPATTAVVSTIDKTDPIAKVPDLEDSGGVDAESIVFQHMPKESSTTTFASGGSSPSREVQEIFSLNSATNYHNEFYDESDVKIEDEENIKTENLTNDSHHQGKLVNLPILIQIKNIE